LGIDQSYAVESSSCFLLFRGANECPDVPGEYTHRSGYGRAHRSWDRYKCKTDIHAATGDETNVYSTTGGDAYANSAARANGDPEAETHTHRDLKAIRALADR
jgi:hypothetical protein